MPNPNVISTTDPKQPGYFRIGFVILQIPPINISTNKVVNDDQLATIRGISPMFIKSGQARWDVTVQWKAVRYVLSDGTFDYSQWTDLRNVVAIFKASPFVEVENDFLRQHFVNLQLVDYIARMGFALKQLRIDSDPDSTNVLDVSLTMSYFNYAPYSKDFGYAYDGKRSVNANSSTQYLSYISNWITSNMDHHSPSYTSPHMSGWESQEEGVSIFKWRNYTFIPFPNSSTSSLPSATPTANAPKVPKPRVGKNLSSTKLSNEIQQIVNAVAPTTHPPLDPAIVMAQILYESGGVNRFGPGEPGHRAVGYMQIFPSTAGKTEQQLTDPTTNIKAGCAYLAQQLGTFGNYPHALGAYNAGPQFIYAYRNGVTKKISAHLGSILGIPGGIVNPDKIKTFDGLPPAGIPHGENTPLYVDTILTNAGRSNLLTPQPPISTNGQPPATSISSPVISVPDKNYQQLVLNAYDGLPQNGNQWLLDYYTEVGAYFFQDNQFVLAAADSKYQSAYTMYSNQVSIVMVNNLPSLPLASFQYPTYQHVGPTDTMISMSFNSVGVNDDNNKLAEPAHYGVQALASMSSQLEDQFIRMRTTVRAVSSIHRMQAVFLQNQILNMLGIQGVMLRGMNTETVSEASNLVQVAIMASQYENVFEEATPFRVNGTAAAYNQALKDLMKGGDLNKLSNDEKNASSTFIQFSNSWKAGDKSYLIQEILSIAGAKSGQPYDILGDMAAVSTIPVAGLRKDEQATLLSQLDLDYTTVAGIALPIETLNENKVTVFGSTIDNLIIAEGSALIQTYTPQSLSGGDVILPTTQGDQFPGLAKRRVTLRAPGQNMSFADCFTFTQLPKLADKTLVGSILSKTEAKFKDTEPAIIDAMYQVLFDWEMKTNPLFGRQATGIVNSPAYSNLFTTAVTVQGPAAQAENAGHFCYKDLGLINYNQTPAEYFFDWNAQMIKDSGDTIESVMGTTNVAANSVNATQSISSAGTPAPASNKTFTPNQDDSGFTWSGMAQSIPGQANSLKRMMKLPAFSMDTAYPTYKLLLIEEDNTGPFFCFDNFYSWASVMDIEIIKYRDKPDTAIIQITNLANLLEHRLYDDSAAGRMERDADKWNNAPGGGLAVTPQGLAATTGGNPTGGITAGKAQSMGGAPYQRVPQKNMTEGRGDATIKVPLKYFALQTGSKIQVRMGFSNNPDALYPVFTGQVTAIEGEDILTITAQSFQLELMNTPGSVVKSNSWWGFSALSGGAAFGGMQIWNSGTTTNVMQTMLTAPVARHFGHWQIGGVPDRLVKGFEWKEAGAKALAKVVTSPKIAPLIGLLQTGYDRSGENILINDIINIDGTSQKAANASRSFADANPNTLISTQKYSIAGTSTLSIWDIIKDISRRYPEYNLMVRNYGFPFEADATMVYGHPLDWYYSRPLLLGESEKEKGNNQTQGSYFKTWWDSIGKTKWDDIFKKNIRTAISTGGTITTSNLLTLSAGPGLLGDILSAERGFETPMASSGPEGFYQATLNMHNILSGVSISDPESFFSDVYTPFIQTAQAIRRAGVLALSAGNISGGIFQETDADFRDLYREWEVYLQSVDPNASTGRLKPVRQYHLIDENHIIHNGIKVNDQIYNAVRVKDSKVFPFNQNIPEQHLRVLDITDMINDVNANCKQGCESTLIAYEQSFLRDEVGKMYEGELILRGVPEIEPYDIILLSDPSTGMVGPIEVESVIHSFNLEQGYITIVKPRLFVLVNESCTLGLMATLGMAWSNAMANIHDLGVLHNPFNVNTSGTAIIADVGVALAGIALVGGAIAWGSVGLPLLALVGISGFMMYAEDRKKDNPFLIMPLTRYGRPWIGGIQGFAIGNFAYGLGQSYKWFTAEEIYPVIESWNELLNYRADTLYLTQGT